MVDNCRNCGSRLADEAEYCPRCGVPSSRRLLSPRQILKSVVSFIRPLQHASVGDLEQKETQFGVASATVRSLETRLEVFVAFVKGLPTVLIANLVILLVTVDWSAPLTDTTEVTKGAMITFPILLSVFIVSAFLSARITHLVSDAQRQTRLREAETRAFRRMVYTNFVTYMKEYMPKVTRTELKCNALSPDSAILGSQIHQSWREVGVFSKERQTDMDYAYHDLVEEMDRLARLTKTFITQFDVYAGHARKLMADSRLDVSGSKYPPETYTNSSVIGLYWFSTGIIKTENDRKRPDMTEMLDEPTRVFLDGLFSTQIKTSRLGDGNPASVSKATYLRQLDGYKEMAIEATNARSAHDEAIICYERLRILLESMKYLEP